MRVGLLSDNHGVLDEAILRYFNDCDEVWHAGDFGSLEVLEALRKFKLLRAVYGNVDPQPIRDSLPEDLVWDCEGIRVYMTHIGGYPGHYNVRARKKIDHVKPALFICGHSHILRVVRDPAHKLLHFNPGACGHQGWHQIRTLLRFVVEDGKISEVQAIELGKRGRLKQP